MVLYIVTNEQEPINFRPESEIERVLQNVKNLLRCKMGEVPFDRGRGYDPTIMDVPRTEVDGPMLREIDRVLQWEPRVRMVRTETEALEDGETLIRVTLDVNTEVT